jgi:hypothetical protein
MTGGSDKTILENQKELRGWLVVLSGSFKGRDYRLFEGRNIVGSGHYSDVYLPDPTLESSHFSIRFDKREAWITDLDSHSGLFLDDKRTWKEKITDETQFKASGIDFLIKMV